MFFYRLCRADTETKSQYNHSVFLFYSEFYLPVASHQRKQTTKNGAGYTNWLSTYYIYDDLNNLRCVIQPEGVKAIVSNWSLTTTLLDEQCFRYEYDERGRMVMKKVPGAGEVWMVYDTRDRLVLTSDAKLRANGQ